MKAKNKQKKYNTHRKNKVHVDWSREHNRRLGIRNRAVIGNGVVMDALQQAGLV